MARRFTIFRDVYAPGKFLQLLRSVNSNFHHLDAMPIKYSRLFFVSGCIVTNTMYFLHFSY